MCKCSNYYTKNLSKLVGLLLTIFQDFDIAGQYDPMLPDSECLRIIYEALKSLELGPFTIKVNHRCLLDGIFAACGVPSEKFRTICSAVDKLDKSPWEEVRKEMVEEKGLEGAIADKIGTYVSRSGKRDLVDELRKDVELMKQPAAVQGVDSMELLLKYCEIFKIMDNLVFDLSLARGLDYYTGVIFEAILTGKYYFSLLSSAYIQKANVKISFFTCRKQRWCRQCRGRWPIRQSRRNVRPKE